MNLFAETATCLRFFSRLPLPPAPADAPPLATGVRLLPLAGALLGAGSAATLLLATAIGLPGGVAAGAALTAGTLLSGGLHEDGLADTADGFGGGTAPARKLAIMRDSHIGTYGVLAIGFSLGLRWTALAALADRHGAWVAAAALVGAGALSRALALLPMALLPPARADGLGRGFGRPAPAVLAVCAALALGIGVAAPAAAALTLAHATLACAAALGGAAWVARLAGRQIGGHTGDVAGAAQQVAEAAYLAALLVLPGKF